MPEGIAPEQAENDYIRFLGLMNQEGLEISTNGNYGFRSQLRFGYVVGDALGIDPAFDDNFLTRHLRPN